jgi:hypothetical protein
MDDPIAGLFRSKSQPQATPSPKLEIPPLASPPQSYTVQTSTANIRTHRLSSMLEKYPFGWISGGRFEPTDIAAVAAQPGARHWTEQALKQNSIMERNYALAATTPVLGQYAPTYGWPESP